MFMKSRGEIRRCQSRPAPTADQLVLIGQLTRDMRGTIRRIDEANAGDNIDEDDPSSPLLFL
jgi:Ni,Fe-hydrogenase III small subunit